MKLLKLNWFTGFDAVLTDNGAVVVESKDWAKRRFAYEIKDFQEVSITSEHHC